MPRTPVAQRWARFGPTNRAWFSHVPEGGFCVSVFLVVHNHRGDVLLGQPAVHADWPERGCVPLWRLKEIQRQGGWILPASHFLMDESPQRAASRVRAQWAGLSRGTPRLVTVTSELLPTGRWAGAGPTRRRVNHWALCFVYELTTEETPRPRASWRELRFFSRRELRRLTFGREHGDLLKEYARAAIGRERSPATRPPS